MDAHQKFIDVPSRFAKDGDVAFQKWFDGAESLQENLTSGFTDFVHQIFKSDTYTYVGNPASKTVLEIGVGGGRLALPAAFFFGQVLGIDIHRELQRAEAYCARYGRSNVKLLHADDVEQIVDVSVDFVYSFITFQHFTGWNIAQEYLKLCRRVMKPGALGIIYLSENTSNDDDVFTIKPSTVQHEFTITMTVKRSFAINEFENHGFKVIDVGTTTKQPWSKSLSKQFYIRFMS